MYYSIAQQYDLDDDMKRLQLASVIRVPRLLKITALSLVITLLASLSLNIYYINQHSQTSEATKHVPSKYGIKLLIRPFLYYISTFIVASLYQDVPTEIVKHTDYNSPNRTIENAAWNNPDLLPEHGFIALDDFWSASKGLPTAQRWPWDKTKGVYILTSSHELHCVVSLCFHSSHPLLKFLPQRIIRESINQAYDSLPQSWPHSHILHCLNVLRESVMCNADDTPLYTGRLHKEAHATLPKAGIGSIKMCRSWAKLQAFARDHSACWARIGIDDSTFPETERYKYCPDGSRPWDGKPALGVYGE